MEKKQDNLTRSEDAKLFGVLSGFAEYYHWNKTWTRLIFALVMVITKVIPLLLVYFLAAFIMDKEKEEGKVIDY